ncbi:hypothetical protein C8R48DRAFT_258225 [Suillus tomentosus]|nr:hypothetical protein C8R48DRAFT_258225 [Suillus tomentosus]
MKSRTDHVLVEPDAYLMKEAKSLQLGIWQPLHNRDLLLASSTSRALKMQTLWIIGTVRQNNSAARVVVSHHHPSMHPPHVRKRTISNPRKFPYFDAL